MYAGDLVLQGCKCSAARCRDDICILITVKWHAFTRKNRHTFTPLEGKSAMNMFQIISCLILIFFLIFRRFIKITPKMIRMLYHLKLWKNDVCRLNLKIKQRVFLIIRKMSHLVSSSNVFNKKSCVFCFRARGSETPRSKSISNGKPIQRGHFRPSAASLQIRLRRHQESSPHQIPLPALALVRLISKSR